MMIAHKRSSNRIHNTANANARSAATYKWNACPFFVWRHYYTVLLVPRHLFLACSCSFVGTAAQRRMRSWHNVAHYSEIILPLFLRSTHSDTIAAQKGVRVLARLLHGFRLHVV